MCCTHLTFMSASQGPELDKLLRDFPSNMNGCTPVLLGDFNHGPEVRNGTVVLAPPENGPLHSRVLAAGYTSPYATEVGKCTICPCNAIRAAKGKGGIELIDHIYVVANDSQIKITDPQVCYFF